MTGGRGAGSGRRAARALVMLAALLPQTGDGRVGRVDVRTHTRVTVAPADLVARITLAPDAQHRWLVFEVDGDPGEYRQSRWPLEGADTWRVRQVWVTALPAGCYELRATVYSDTRALGSARDGPVHVLDRRTGADPCA